MDIQSGVISNAATASQSNQIREKVRLHGKPKQARATGSISSRPHAWVLSWMWGLKHRQPTGGKKLQLCKMLLPPGHGDGVAANSDQAT